MQNLTEKQRRFCDEYIISGSAGEAAKKAGYSRKYAAQNADKLLKNTKISQYIDKRLEQLKSEKVAEQEEIMQFLTAIVRGQVMEKVPLGLGYGAQELVDKVPDVKDRIRAAELLGKRYAVWTDKQLVNVVPTFIEDVPKEDCEELH